MKTLRSKTLRTVSAAAVLLLTVSGLLWHNGWGTLSSFGIDSIAAVCPLGALETMLADRTFLPRAFIGLLIFLAAAVLFGRIFCGWLCPVPLVKRLTGAERADARAAKAERKETEAALVTACAHAPEKTAAAGAEDAPQKAASCGTSSGCAACASKTGSCGTAAEKLDKTPFVVLGGALASSAVFGFPVFCLICPVGLTFALVIALWRLFEFNEPTWSILYFAGFLVLELFVLRRWCHRFCPLGALISLMSTANRFFRATVNENACVRSKGIACRVCREACPEGIDLHAEPDALRLARCTKCRACADACPTKAISFPFMKAKEKTVVQIFPDPVPLRKTAPAERIGNFAEVDIPLTREEAVRESARCLLCGECVKACPQGNPIPDMMALMREGRVREAGALMLEAGRFPEICSRICPQERLCEKACAMGALKGAVAIGAVERAAAEAVTGRGWRPQRMRARRKMTAAVIGAGPAGLAFADVLARKGAAVTVYEKDSAAGGLLLRGIPAFKLEKTVLEKRRAVLEKLGVRFEFGRAVERASDFESIRNAVDAVFVGTGAGPARRLSIPGADAAGVWDALSWLREASEGALKPGSLAGKTVLVLGGGDTAVDVLRTAVRLGAETALCAYRRSEEKMRASPAETAAAKEEGARFRFNEEAASVETTEGGRLRVTLRNTSGMSEETFEADLLVTAFGQERALIEWLLSAGAKAGADGTLLTDSEGRTTLSGVYAGGDVIRGPALAVYAMADGRRAAEAAAADFGL